MNTPPHALAAMLCKATSFCKTLPVPTHTQVWRTLHNGANSGSFSRDTKGKQGDLARAEDEKLYRSRLVAVEGLLSNGTFADNFQYTVERPEDFLGSINPPRPSTHTGTGGVRHSAVGCHNMSQNTKSVPAGDAGVHGLAP